MVEFYQLSSAVMLMLQSNYMKLLSVEDFGMLIDSPIPKKAKVCFKVSKLFNELI